MTVAAKSSTKDLEGEKFVDDSNGKTAVNTVEDDGFSSANQTTKHFPGTAVSADTSVPAAEGNIIIIALLINQETVPGRDLDFSFDGGTTFSTLKAGNFIGWSPKGNLKQVVVKRTGSTDVTFDIMLNRKL